MKNKIILMLVIIMIIFNYNGISLTNQNQFEVKVNVAAMQQLIVKEDVGVSFTYPWKGMESGQPLIFRNVGKLNIKSNVDWGLNIDSIEIYRDIEIYISQAGANTWQRVDKTNSLITGEYGNHNISWDIKIVQARLNYNLNRENTVLSSPTKDYQDIRTVNMVYTLTQL